MDYGSVDDDDDRRAVEVERRQREELQAQRRAEMLRRGPVKVVTVAAPITTTTDAAQAAAAAPPPLVQQFTATASAPATTPGMPAHIGARESFDAGSSGSSSSSSSSSSSTSAATAAAAAPGHIYYPNEGIIVMPVVAHQPVPPARDATPEEIERYNMALAAAQRQQALEEYLDLIYQFVGFVVHDLGAGYDMGQFWKGEVSGRGALHAFLHKAEKHWLDQQMIDPATAQGGRFHSATMLEQAQKMQAAHAASSVPSSKSSSEARQATGALEALREIINQALTGNGFQVNEPLLRAYDMLYFHNGEYIPPNGHEVRTPRETLEVALRLIQLERFFLTNTAGGDDHGLMDGRSHSIFVDGRAVHQIFLDPSMIKGIEDATRFVHDVCRRAHIAQIDLMTHARVRANFSRLVASMMNMSSELNPRRPVTKLVMRMVKHNHDILRRYFENVDYARDGFLADMRTFDAGAEARRRSIEASRLRHMLQTGTYYTDVNRSYEKGPAVVAPARIGQSIEAARRQFNLAMPVSSSQLRSPVTMSNFAASPAAVPSIMTTAAAAIANPNVVAVSSTPPTDRGRDRERDRAPSPPSPSHWRAGYGYTPRRGRVVFAQET